MGGSRNLGLAAIVTACLFWGGSFFFGKVALRELTAVEVVWWRFMLAFTLLAPVLVTHALRRARGRSVRGALRPARRDLPLFVLNAILMVPLQFLLQFEGLARTSASSAALLVGSFAPMMALAGVFLSRESLNGSGWLAVLLSTLGVGLLVGLPGEGRSILGDLLVVSSLVCAVGMVVVTQRLLRSYSAIMVTTWGIGLGTLFLTPWMLGLHAHLTLSMSGGTWAALVGLGFGCTAIAFSLWNWGLHYVPASRAGVFVNLEPLIGALLGVLVLREAVTGGLLVGGGLILGAALLVSWPRPAPALSV